MVVQLLDDLFLETLEHEAVSIELSVPALTRLQRDKTRLKGNDQLWASDS